MYAKIVKFVESIFVIIIPPPPNPMLKIFLVTLRLKHVHACTRVKL